MDKYEAIQKFKDHKAQLATALKQLSDAQNSGQFTNPFATKIDVGSLEAQVTTLEMEMSEDMKDFQTAKADSIHRHVPSVVTGCKTQKEFQNKNHDLIAYAIGERIFDKQGMFKVEGLLEESGKIHGGGLTKPQLFCTGENCLSPDAQKIIAANPDKTQDAHKLSLTTKLIATQLTDKDGKQLSPEEAKKQVAAHPDTEKKAEDKLNKILKNECEAQGVPFKPVHIEEYKKLHPEELEKYQELLKGSSEEKVKAGLKSVRTSGVEAAIKSGAVSAQDAAKYAALVDNYSKWVSDKYGADALKTEFNNSPAQCATSLTKLNTLDNSRGGASLPA